MIPHVLCAVVLHCSSMMCVDCTMLTHVMLCVCVCVCLCVCVCVFRSECEKQVNGYSGAKYKKFKTREEAEAFVLSEGFSSSSGQQSHAMPHYSSESPDSPASGQPHRVTHGKHEAGLLSWLLHERERILLYLLEMGCRPYRRFNQNALVYFRAKCTDTHHYSEG